MTQHVLSADLSFCLVDHRPIFLNMAKDRYFRLSSQLEVSFLEWLANGPTSAVAPCRVLVELGILQPRPDGYKRPDVFIPGPLHSALELPTSPTRLGSRAVVAAFASVLLTQLQLKVIGLSPTIARVFPCAQRSSSRPDMDLTAMTIEVHKFLAARRLVPLDTSCLLDSLALARFLRRRGLKTNMVFGVTGDPFSAHCWLQIGDVVLNDALGNVRTYTRIRAL